MTDEKFSWVQTHKELSQYISTKENDQKGLIDLLKSVGIGPFNDKSSDGETIELEEIDPFTFYCYIYKYGSEKRLQNLQAIARQLNLTVPSDVDGIPSAQAQKVWLFPYKSDRNHNEIERLWNLFHKELKNEITDSDFADVLKIKSVGKTKLTEVLFYVDPAKYLPINGPAKPYLQEVVGIKTSFATYNEYLKVLRHIKEKTNVPFKELSFEAWKWNEAEKANKKNSDSMSGQQQDKSEDNSQTQYWLYSPGENASKWDEFYDDGIAGLNWDAIGDLTQYQDKEEIKQALLQAYGGSGSKMNDVLANDEFKNQMRIGDLIIAKKGKRELIGYGIVRSDYIFDESRTDYKSVRKVEWKRRGKWELNFDLVLKTLTNITEYETEHPGFKTYHERLMAVMAGKMPLNIIPAEYPESVANIFLNTILYGPPGTGKTYNTVLKAAEIVSNRVIDNYKEALNIFKKNLHDQIEFITFHQNYSYEDFIQGLRPDTENDSGLIFERKDGVFKIMADRALENIRAAENPGFAKKSFETAFNEFMSPMIEGEVEEIEVKMKKVSYFITSVSDKSVEFRKASGGTEHKLSLQTLKKMYEAESVLNIQGLESYYSPLLNKLLESSEKESGGKKEIVQRKNYVIIIDEINRANISRVFGELLTLIEPDKRSNGQLPMESKLPSGDVFIVPSNLFILGTMNTADKSIALLDIALRRRFEFEPMYPLYDIPHHEIYDVDILKKINEQIIKLKGYDFQIGHSYFMGKNKDLIHRMNKKVIPLLLEYFMNDEKEVTKILNSAGLAIEEGSWPLKITGRNDQSV